MEYIYIYMVENLHGNGTMIYHDGTIKYLLNFLSLLEQSRKLSKEVPKKNYLQNVS